MIQLQISLEYSFEYLSLKSIANYFHYLNCHSISQIPIYNNYQPAANMFYEMILNLSLPVILPSSPLKQINHCDKSAL